MHKKRFSIVIFNGINVKGKTYIIVNIQLIFMVAIRLVMFSAGIGGGESKSMRLTGGVSVDLLMVGGPGAPLRPVGGESAEVLSPAEVPPWAEVWGNDTEEPVSELLPASFSSAFVYGLS